MSFNFFIYLIVFFTVFYFIYENIHLRKENRLLRQLKPRDLWLVKERIKLMNPRDFEYFCGSLFALLGYRADVTKSTKDGGKDIILYDTKNNEYTFVECKHWKDCIVDDVSEETEEAYKTSCIGQDIAQKLRGAMDYGFDGKKSINKGIIISTTRFTVQCQKYCNAMNISMIDIDGIMKLVEQVGTDYVYAIAGIKRDGYLTD